MYGEHAFFRQQAPCTAARPFFLDVGANIGMHTLAALHAGCSTVSFEPMARNVGRLWQSVLRNGYEGRGTVFKAAAGAQPGAFVVHYEASNPGASRLLESVSAADAAASAASVEAASAYLAAAAARHTVPVDALELAFAVTVDSLFGLAGAEELDARALLPRHPTAAGGDASSIAAGGRRAVRPEDFAAVKVDAEGAP